MAEGKVRSKARKNKGMVKFKAENKGAAEGKAKSMKKNNGVVQQKAWHGTIKGTAWHCDMLTITYTVQCTTTNTQTRRSTECDCDVTRAITV